MSKHLMWKKEKNFEIIYDGIIAIYWNFSKNYVEYYAQKFCLQMVLRFVCLWNSTCRTINKHDFVK